MSSIKQIMRNRSLSRSSGGAKRIATSAIPKVDDKTLQTWVKSIDSAVKEVLKQSLTFNDLVNIGLVKFDNGKLTSLIPKEEEVNLTVPLAILNLSARGAYGSVTVIWNTPKSSLFGMNIVYRSELNDFGTAVQVGSTAGDVYTDYIGNNHKVYYWVRTVSKYGVEGHLSPSAYAATSIDIDYLLENLNEKIDESLLDQALRGKIEDTADGLANEEQNRISEDLRVGLEIAREAKERALAIANESKLLNQKIAEETQNLINQIENQSNTLSQDTINRVLALQEEIQSKINTLNNGITTETENRIDEDNAIASSLTAYKTSNNNAVSTVLSKAESAITANNALSSRLDALVASLTESDGTTIDANAFNAMRAEVTTLNGTVSTLVEDVTALENSYSSALDLINTHGSAINTLQTKLTEMGNVVTQSANDITILKSDMGTVKNGLSTKAEAEAVENLETRVTKTEDSQSALSHDVTNLSASITAQAVGDAITGTKDAINALKIVGDLSKVSLVDEPTATTGKVIRLGGNNGNDYLPATSNTFIPIRADRLYRIKYRFRRFAGTSKVYIGLICANSDKTKGITRTNQEKDVDLISAEMFAVSGLSPTTMQWVEGEFYFKGRSTSASTGLGTKESPMTYPAKASYMRLCLISGYLTGAGQYDFDYIILEDAEIIALNDAQASALSSTQAQVVEIDGRVKSSADDLISLKGRVNAAEGVISQKADASALNNYFTKVEAGEATAGQITEFKSKLVIGGKNLIRDSDKWKNSVVTSTGLSCSFSGDFNEMTITAVEGNGNWVTGFLNLIHPDDIDMSLNEGDDVVFSVDVSITNGSSTNFPDLYWKDKMAYFPLMAVGGQERRYNEWYRIYQTRKYIKGQNSFHLGFGHLVGEFKFRRPMVEKGNIPSAWVINDDDVKASLNANALAINATNTEVSRIDDEVNVHSESINQLSASLSEVNGLAGQAFTNAANAQQTANAAVNASSANANNIITINSRMDSSAQASENILINSNVELPYNGHYPHGVYDMGEAWEAGATYTLLFCATHKRASGDGVTTLAPYAGDWAQLITSILGDGTKQVYKNTFVASSGQKGNCVNFFLLSANGGYYLDTIATVHWAVLVKDSNINTSKWIPSKYDQQNLLSQKLDASVINNYYTKTEANAASAGQLAAFEASLSLGGGLLDVGREQAIPTVESGVGTYEIIDRATNHFKMVNQADSGFSFYFGFCHNSDHVEVGTPFVFTGKVRASRAELYDRIYMRFNQFDSNSYVWGWNSSTEWVTVTAKGITNTGNYSATDNIIGAYIPNGRVGDWIEFKDCRVMVNTDSMTAANADAISHINTQVTNIDGRVTASANQLINLNAELDQRKIYRLYSGGADAATGEQGFIQGFNPDSMQHIGRSYGLVVFAGDGSIQSVNTYDVYGGHVQPFIDAVASVPIGTWVAVLTTDEPNGNSALIIDSLKSLGGTDAVRQTIYRSAYLLVGRKGLSEGSAIELVSNKTAMGCTYMLEMFNGVPTSMGGTSPQAGIVSQMRSEVTTLNGNVQSISESTTRHEATLATVGRKSISKEHEVDLRSMDSNMYYPVGAFITTESPSYFEVGRTLGSFPQKPEWSSHDAGFVCQCSWSATGHGWGTSGINRVITDFKKDWTVSGQSALLGPHQLGNSSFEFVWLRGGAQYKFFTSGNINELIVVTSETVYSGQAIAPIPYDASLVPQSTLGATAVALDQVRAVVQEINGQVTSLAVQTNTLSTTVGDNTAAIQSHASSIDGMQTQFTLKMDVNGLVSGIGMMNDGVTSDFIVNANTFAIGSPTSNFRPFIATSTETIINGVPAPAGVHINTALIANGTLKNAQIGDLSADKITTGDIHADRMKANIVKAVEGQFDNLGAITAKIGHLRTADTGARLEFKGNLLTFFDSDETPIIYIGEWDEDPIEIQ